VLLSPCVWVTGAIASVVAKNHSQTKMVSFASEAETSCWRSLGAKWPTKIAGGGKKADVDGKRRRIEIKKKQAE